jgi:hypothetical protein
MALHDPNSLLALIAGLLNVLGNFFAILLGTYDTNAFWEERFLSGNIEDYYLHIFCWSLDEYGRARAVCWFLAIVAVVALYLTVNSCRGSRRYAAERRALESELDACRKGRIEDGIKIADLDAGSKLLKDRNDHLEKDLTDLKKQATITAENDAQIILNANGRADNFEKQLKTELETNEQLEEKVEALERKDKTAQNYIIELEKNKDRLEKKLKGQHKDAEALENQVGKLMREKTDATRQYSTMQNKFVIEEAAKGEEREKATKAKAAENKATQ